MAALFEKPSFLILILLILLLFGAKRLPELARGVGRSLRIFKSETEELRSDGEALAPADAYPAGSLAPVPQPVRPAVPDAPRGVEVPATQEQARTQP